MELGKKGDGQGHRVQQLLLGAGVIIMGAGDEQGNDHVAGHQGGRGVPAWGSVKKPVRAMSSLCSERFFIKRKGKEGLMSFSNLNMAMHSRTGKSGKRPSEWGTTLSERVEATLGVVL